MNPIEKYVRRIAREEIEKREAERRREWADAFRELASAKRGPVPYDMMRSEADALRCMGLDPFEEAEKPKPDWMDCFEAAQLRAAGTDPMAVSREAIRGTFIDKAEAVRALRKSHDELSSFLDDYRADGN